MLPLRVSKITVRRCVFSVIFVGNFYSHLFGWKIVVFFSFPSSNALLHATVFQFAWNTSQNIDLWPMMSAYLHDPFNDNFLRRTFFSIRRSLHSYSKKKRNWIENGKNKYSRTIECAECLSLALIAAFSKLRTSIQMLPIEIDMRTLKWMRVLRNMGETTTTKLHRPSLKIKQFVLHNAE